MKQPKIPKPASPTAVAAAQTESNQSTAMFQQMLNMQDQRDPYGSLTWQSAGEWSYKDPVSGKTVTVPKFMSSTVLSPEQQALLDQEQQFDARWNQMALDQTNRVKDTLSKPFDYSPGIHEEWAGGIYDKLQNPSIARGRDDLQQQLANRGLNYGTQAYDQAMKDFYEGNQRARDAFMLDSYGTGMNTALTIRNQPLKEGAALMGGGQITEPQWLSGPQASVSPTDIGGIYSSNYSQQMARAQAQQQQSAGMWGALGQLGGAALGGWLASDKRKKKNIRDTGRTAGGLPIKSWQYRGGEGPRHEGPMAQDVEKLYPEAVADVGGTKMVHFPSIPGGRKMMEDILDAEGQRSAPPPGSEHGQGAYSRPDYNMNSLPRGEWLRGPGMVNPKGDPFWDIDEAAQLPKYRDASTRGRKGLQQLGSRRVA